jgi:hypothetical protein
VVTLETRKAKEAVAAPMVVSAFGGSLESGSQFSVGAFGRNLTSVAVKMFSNLI